MSIKSGKWIRRMAQQQGMIDPFEPEWKGYVTLAHDMIPVSFHSL